jgi:hypothetical protein
LTCFTFETEQRSITTINLFRVYHDGSYSAITESVDIWIGVLLSRQQLVLDTVIELDLLHPNVWIVAAVPAKFSIT